MIVFLAVIVGSIVIAMFLPLIDLMNRVGESGGGKKDEWRRRGEIRRPEPEGHNRFRDWKI